MSNAFDFTYDQEYDLLLNGFDVKVMESDQGPGYFFIKVFEDGQDAYSIDLPIPVGQEGEHPEELVNQVAQAAIDIFESERGTLGQGAGVMATKKKAFTYEINEHNEWYMSLKGTPYEDAAYNLLQDLYSLDLEENAVEDHNVELYDEQREIEYQLKALNLERLKAIPAGSQIIIIQAALKKSAWFSNVQDIQDFMNLFAGSPQESEVVKLLSRYLDIKQELNKQDENWSELYERHDAIHNQMESLSLEALQSNVIDKLPTSGIEAFPGMANDIVELMEGVDMDEPLDPMSGMGMPVDAFGESMGGEMGREPMEPNEFMALASKRALEEVESVEDRIIEQGEIHDGLDMSEIDKDELPFQKGDSVTLSEAWEGSTVGGCPLKLDKGSKGVIENVFDGHGDSFMVAFDDGQLLRVPASSLK